MAREKYQLFVEGENGGCTYRIPPKWRCWRFFPDDKQPDITIASEHGAIRVLVYEENGETFVRVEKKQWKLRDGEQAVGVSVSIYDGPIGNPTR